MYVLLWFCFKQGRQRHGLGLGLGECPQPADKLAGALPAQATQQEEEEVERVPHPPSSQK